MSEDILYLFNWRKGKYVKETEVKVTDVNARSEIKLRRIIKIDN